MNTKVTYSKTEDAWVGFEKFITDMIESYHVKGVCEVGGGANPLIKAEYIRDNAIDYAILDVSKEELDKAPLEYKKIEAEISDRDFMLSSKFDLVFSKMLAEHIEDAEQFHKNVFSILNKGGLSIHFFPTLYAFPFLVNRVFPETITNKLLNFFSPRDLYQHAKFPAYYSWCRGPTGTQIKRFTDLGYEVVEYRGYFGHSFYYNRVPLIKRLHVLITSYLLKNPKPLFTSYAWVVLKKP